MAVVAKAEDIKLLFLYIVKSEAFSCLASILAL